MDKRIVSACGIHSPQHLGQTNGRSSTLSRCPLEVRGGRVWWSIRRGKGHDTKGSATLGIATLGIAIVYLLVLVAVAVGALGVLVWLFGEAPGEGERTGHETAGSLRSADRFGAGSAPSASVGPDRSKDRAA